MTLDAYVQLNVTNLYLFFIYFFRNNLPHYQKGLSIQNLTTKTSEIGENKTPCVIISYEMSVNDHVVVVSSTVALVNGHGYVFQISGPLGHFSVKDYSPIYETVKFY